MHPYQMQSLLRLRHKDEILALKRGSLYHAIGRLVRDELIAAKSTTRNGRRPERTTYAITATGRKEFTRVLRNIIAVPRRESSEFMAAMSFLVHLTPGRSPAPPRRTRAASRKRNRVTQRRRLRCIGARAPHQPGRKRIPDRHAESRTRLGAQSHLRNLIRQSRLGSQECLERCARIRTHSRAPRGVIHANRIHPRQHKPASAGPDSLSRRHLDTAHPRSRHQRSPQRLHAPQHSLRTHS